MDPLRGQGMIAMLVKGLLEQPAELGDENYVNDVRDNFFRKFLLFH